MVQITHKDCASAPCPYRRQQRSSRSTCCIARIFIPVCPHSQAKQCKDYMRPFLRMTKNHTLPADMLKLTVEIVDHCRVRLVMQSPVGSAPTGLCVLVLLCIVAKAGVSHPAYPYVRVVWHSLWCLTTPLLPLCLLLLTATDSLYTNAFAAPFFRVACISPCTHGFII